MTVFFEQYNDATRTEISLDASYKTDYEAGELIKFLTRVYTDCNGSGNEGLPFDAHVAEIIKHNFWLVQIVEELLVAHLIDYAF